MPAATTTAPGGERGGAVQDQPAGGGRLVPWLVAAGLLAAVGSVPLLGFRVPGLLLAALLVACALARLLLPVRMVTTLAVRSRAADVVTLTALALAVAGLALTAPGA